MLNFIITEKSTYREQSRFAAVLFYMIFIISVLVISGCKKEQTDLDTPQMKVDKPFWVRVLLLDDVSVCSLQGSGGFTVKTVNGKSVHIKSAHTLRISCTDNKFWLGDQQINTDQLEISFGKSAIFILGSVHYRGKIRIFVNKNAKSFDVINWVPLEPYLAGVVAAEMPGYWKAEALKTQAVVARTYCMYIKERFGKKRRWDLSSTQAHQVYKGLKAESPVIWQVIHDTWGEVLTVKNKKDQYSIFPTYYSAICGGYTENSKYVFGDSFVTLEGVPCSFCQDIVRLDQFYWPAFAYSKDLVSKKLLRRYSSLKKLGSIKDITAIVQNKRAGFSRITRFKLIGTNDKTDILRAEDFRLCLDPSGKRIKSTAFVLQDWSDQWAFVSGKGWGHGVGLCQWGTQSLAKKGRLYKDILLYYYPESHIEKLY